MSLCHDLHLYTPSLYTLTPSNCSESTPERLKCLSVFTLHSAVPRDAPEADGDALQDVSPEKLQSTLQRVVSKTVSSFKAEINQKLKSSEQSHLSRLALVEKTLSWVYLYNYACMQTTSQGHGTVMAQYISDIYICMQLVQQYTYPAWFPPKRHGQCLAYKICICELDQRCAHN